MYRQYIKRPVDLTVAVIGLIVVIPVCLVVYIAVQLTSRGPAIFVQERTGRGGQVFKMYKFRTMAANNNVHDTSTENTITGLGHTLRALSLDEIPQLLNVAKGQMSFIGPRPWIHTYYQNMTARQRQRVSVLPGITGLAQAYGRNNLSIHDKLKLDLQYVQKVSFLTDMNIVLKTIEAVFKRSGQEISKLSIVQEIETLKQQLALELGQQDQPTAGQQLSLSNAATFYAEAPSGAKTKRVSRRAQSQKVQK